MSTASGFSRRLEQLLSRLRELYGEPILYNIKFVDGKRVKIPWNAKLKRLIKFNDDFIICAAIPYKERNI